MLESGGVVNFRNKRNYLVVKGFRHMTYMEEALNGSNDVIFYDVPEFLEEKKAHTISAWGFVWIHRGDCFFYFTLLHSPELKMVGTLCFPVHSCFVNTSSTAKLRTLFLSKIKDVL